MDSIAIRSSARSNRTLAVALAAMVALAIACLVGLALDPRTLGGQPVWLKPMKFALSFVLYLGTMLWMIPLVTGRRASRWARRAGVVLAVTALIEVVAIGGQAARGRMSHFSYATPFDTVVWSTMGTAITAFWLATAALGVLLLRERSLTGATAWSVRLGLGVALFGMAAAFLMTTPTPDQLAATEAGAGMPVIGGHAVGVPDGGAALPIVGWSTTGGDLRIGHFVGLHALQGLPLLAFGLTALAARLPVLRQERTRAHLVVVAGAAWAGLTLLLIWQALRGQSIVAPDALTLGALGALVVATAAAGAVVVRTAPRPAGEPTPSTTLEPR